MNHIENKCVCVCVGGGGGGGLNSPVKIYNSKNALRYFDFCVA